MAKETMIVFVYDTECLKDEADDPVNAVLYFHPSWVSDTQKVALCGQLMGTSYFLKDCFFKPRILSLQNGKFILNEFGRFILAVGTDRNISDYLLEYRAKLLASLVRLFHRDLQSVYDQYSLSGQYKNLSEKLYHIFETYLPILQFKGNIFHSTPKLRIPKTASNIFLEAIQTLQCCQQTKGVLGGAILYHNKVVSSQLSDQITQQLVLTDPLHVRTTAEQISSLDFHIPNGVQMIVIYIETEQYRKLAADAQRAQNLQTQQLSQGSGALPFQYAKRKMKRDKSLIFTNIPEEGSTTITTDQVDGSSKENGPLPPLPTLPLGRSKPLLRPTHLPLRFKNMTSRELPESGIASINFDENDSYPEFIGRTSVCSTPLTENKVLQVGNIMSICANPEDENNSNSKKVSNQPDNNRRNSIKIDFDKFFQNFIINPNKIERRNSFTDLQDSIKKISKKLSLKNKFSNGFKTDVNRNGSCAETPADFIENGVEGEEDIDDDNSDTSDEHNKTSRTITDPTYPVFNANGQPISRSLFQEFLERYYKLWDGAADNYKQETEIAQLIDEFKEFDNELKKLNDTLVTKDSNKPIATFKADSNLNIEEIVVAEKTRTLKTPLDKKSLSLPLKPLSDATPNDAAAAIPCGASSISHRKQSGGIPLTPLMAKLSVLALNEERSTSGFCSWDTTPGGVEIQTPLDSTKVFGRRRSSLKCDDAVDAVAALNASKTTSTKSDLQRVELYICGQQNMTLLLLLEQGSGSKQQIVQNMFDICVAKFPHMESHLNQLLNVNVEGDRSDGGYSFMCIDAKWNALQRNGPWNPVEINTLESMHYDLQLSGSEVTDLILRPNDTVFYGYKSGRTEFFYKEPVRQVTGIPPPSDPMGNVAMRAKTRLERDHSYVLF